MVDNLNYMFIKDARILFKWSLCIFLGKLVLSNFSDFFFFRAEPELDRYMGLGEDLFFVMSKLVHCFARIFNATAICVLSDIFQHFRRNKHRYIVGVLLLLLSHFSHVRPLRRQPTRLLCPWDSPGKNTGVGCHFLLHRWSTGVQPQINKLKALLFLKIYGKLNVDLKSRCQNSHKVMGFVLLLLLSTASEILSPFRGHLITFRSDKCALEASLRNFSR